MTRRTALAVILGIFSPLIASKLTPLSLLPDTLLSLWEPVAEVLFQIALGLVAVVLLLLIGRSDRTRVTNRKSVLSTGAAFLLYIVGVSVYFLVYKITGHHVSETTNVPNLKGTWQLPIYVTAVSYIILAPVIEETIFRGVVFVGLRRYVPFWIAAVISAIAFAYWHSNALPLQMLIVIGMFGLCAAWLRERTGSLIPGMIFHSLVNANVVIHSPSIVSQHKLIITLGCLSVLGLLLTTGHFIVRKLTPNPKAHNDQPTR
jgi:membrane protease YdiL (CAAX protease family)